MGAHWTPGIPCALVLEASGVMHDPDAIGAAGSWNRGWYEDRAPKSDFLRRRGNERYFIHATHEWNAPGDSMMNF
jgi:hypothetical protein